MDYLWHMFMIAWVGQDNRKELKVAFSNRNRGHIYWYSPAPNFSIIHVIHPYLILSQLGTSFPSLFLEWPSPWLNFLFYFHLSLLCIYINSVSHILFSTLKSLYSVSPPCLIITIFPRSWLKCYKIWNVEKFIWWEEEEQHVRALFPKWQSFLLSFYSTQFHCSGNIITVP